MKSAPLSALSRRLRPLLLLGVAGLAGCRARNVVVVGQDTAAANRKIVCEETTWSVGKGYLREQRTSSRFYLEESGHLRLELGFLSTVISPHVHNQDLCKPVAGTPLWITAGFFEPGPEIHIIVFDSHAVRTHRRATLDTEHHQYPFFHFEDGNHRLIYSVSAGESIYDVLADETRPLGK